MICRISVIVSFDRSLNTVCDTGVLYFPANGFFLPGMYTDVLLPVFYSTVIRSFFFRRGMNNASRFLIGSGAKG